jgi:hypothetical protein
LRTIAIFTDRSSLVMGACALSLGLLAGCGEAIPGSNDEGASPASPPAGVETLTYEAPLGETTWIFAHVEGRAVCVMHDVGAPASDAAPIYADAAGWIRVGIEPSPTVSEAPLALDCTGPDGRVVERALAIRAIPAGAVPANSPTPPPVARRTIPALEGDPMAPSQAELAARGYPPRPDPVRAPARYAAWSSLVSTPSQVPLVEHIRAPARSHRVTRGSGSKAGTLTYHNTSGAIATGGSATYDQVSANWNVPKISADPAGEFELYESCEWAGLGGDSGLGLIQAGTWDTSNVVGVVLGNGTYVVTHSGWYESTADPANDGDAYMLPTSQYPISHGDTIYSETYICEAQTINFGFETIVVYLPSAGGTYGCMYVNDQTQGWNSGLQPLPIGGPATWVNYLAEWVV